MTVSNPHDSEHKALTVIGAGSWGTALAIASARKGTPTFLWGRDTVVMQEMELQRCNALYLPDSPFPEHLTPSSDLEYCLKHSGAILIAVPSHAFREIVLLVKPFIATILGVISASKGLDPLRGEFQYTVIREILGPTVPFAVLSGPSFADEVAQGLPTAVVIASRELNFAESTAKLFHQKYFRVYSSSDIAGVQLAGAVKNVLAIAAGINDGLHLGANARAALITRGLAEMIRLGHALGAEVATFMGLAGVGDLILTCSDDQSRNRRFGLALGGGLSVDEAKNKIKQTIEGINTSKEIYKLSVANAVTMPLCTSVYKVLHEGLSIKDAIESLVSRDASSEFINS